MQQADISAGAQTEVGLMQKEIGLIEQFDTAIQRFSTIAARVGEVRDTLYGSQPRSTDDTVSGGDSLAARMRDLHRVATAIEDELDSIQNRF